MSELDEKLKNLEIVALNEKAENAVAVAVATTAATGAVPIPFADAPILIGEQVALMATICGIYGIDIEKDGLKMLCTSAIGAGGAAVVGKSIFTNLIKLIPGAGSAVGGAISAGTAGLITLAMGKAFIEICNMIKLGKLSESDLNSKEGVDVFKSTFRKELSKNKNSSIVTESKSSMEKEEAFITINNVPVNVVEQEKGDEWVPSKDAYDYRAIFKGIEHEYTGDEIYSMTWYIKKEESKIYFVINGSDAGSIPLNNKYIIKA